MITVCLRGSVSILDGKLKFRQEDNKRLIEKV